MDDEKEKAFAHFDALKARLAALHAHAVRLNDAALAADVDGAHAEALLAWEDYLSARGWVEDAGSAARSGGEDKPPRNP